MAAMINGVEQQATFNFTTDLAVGRDVESLAEDILLHLGTAVLVLLLRGAFIEHLVLGPDVHRDIQERLV